MLQPHTYPKLIGKTLVLEADPFITMVDDDNPWLEGLFFTVCIGALIGLAQLIGGLLTTLSLPPANALFEALWQAWSQLGLNLSDDPARIEAAVRRAWDLSTRLAGYSGGWSRLYVLIVTPFALMVQWFVYGALCYVAARSMGGEGTFNQTLGATALMAAPHVLLVLSVVPLVSVSGLLLIVWPLLIVYRAIEVAHDLPWRRAALAAALPLILLGGALLFSALTAWALRGGTLL